MGGSGALAVGSSWFLWGVGYAVAAVWLRWCRCSAAAGERSSGVARGRLLSGLMVALSLDHLRSAGRRCSNRRSRGRNAHLGVRGASRHARRRPTMRDDRRGRGHQNLSRRRPTRRSRRARPPDAPGGDPSRPPPRPSRSTPSKPPLNNIPGAWCSLTARAGDLARWAQMSQCTYRCVVLPDLSSGSGSRTHRPSQCTYRCVVLPDEREMLRRIATVVVSMHLQVRGAP